MTYINKETDYRNIPREMLDKNIPAGRGMVKWAPFATLPEQFETIHQYMIDQNKIDRPVLSDDQLAQLNIRLHEALQNPNLLISNFIKKATLILFSLIYIA